MPSDGNIPSGLQVRFSWLPVEQCHCLGRVEAGDCVAATQTQFERSVRLLIVGDPTGRSIVEPRAVPLPPAWLKRAVALFGLDAVLGVEDTWIVDWTTLREVATLFGERPPRAIMTPSQTIVFKTSEHPQRLWALVEELRSERCSRHDAHPSYTLLTGSPDWTTDAINVECETTARELRKQLETLVPPSTWPEEPPLEEGLCGGAYAHARAFALSHEDVRFVYLDPLFTAMLRFFLQRAWTPEAVEVLGTLPATWGRRSRFDTAP